jgi:hypothetical protein
LTAPAALARCCKPANRNQAAFEVFVQCHSACNQLRAGILFKY